MDVSKASFEERPKGFHQKKNQKQKEKKVTTRVRAYFHPGSYQTTRNAIRHDQISNTFLQSRKRVKKNKNIPSTEQELRPHIKNLYLQHLTAKQIR